MYYLSTQLDHGTFDDHQFIVDDQITRKFIQVVKK